MTSHEQIWADSCCITEKFQKIPSVCEKLRMCLCDRPPWRIQRRSGHKTRSSRHSGLFRAPSRPHSKSIPIIS
ncbi:hypothetical protein Y032_0099g3173 [Ancylostoma ceylanicum]|uniref:Uncharacterized protein n=1 Tax=Ancylostoma ceylanicum TaxID=53326 RepID=A0A016TIQ8_9BILA|nr:hypothetical protein Y032_0099g3173 [Ancylostoma ceylanicum]